MYARGALAKTADNPARGGKIFDRQQVVVTQPEPGDYRAFDAVCTHLGCLVTSVDGGVINCDCHGSRFSLAAGAVVAGPAPFPRVRISVQGDTIRLV